MTAPGTRIEALLKEAMGLHAASIGSASVERAVQVRLAACGARTIDDYWHRLKGSRAELQELIEVVVVPETWFFARPRSVRRARARRSRGMAPEPSRCGPQAR